MPFTTRRLKLNATPYKGATVIIEHIFLLPLGFGYRWDSIFNWLQSCLIII